MCECVFMRTTIELPDEMYKAAKIRAVETNVSLKDLVTRGLMRELEEADQVREPQAPYWSSRKLEPTFAHLKKKGKLKGGADSTTLVSEDRSSREDALF